MLIKRQLVSLREQAPGVGLERLSASILSLGVGESGERPRGRGGGEVFIGTALLPLPVTFFFTPFKGSISPTI